VGLVVSVVPPLVAATHDVHQWVHCFDVFDESKQQFVLLWTVPPRHGVPGLQLRW
jgi:hypothetical protein